MGMKNRTKSNYIIMHLTMILLHIRIIIPRVNVVAGLTDDDVRRWGWVINEKGWVMFPDYQTRLYRNREDIRWEGKVHERIVGYKTHAPLPAEEEWALYHIKDIMRQREQNEYYDTITR